jgi:hypothetical protein
VCRVWTGDASLTMYRLPKIRWTYARWVQEGEADVLDAEPMKDRSDIAYVRQARCRIVEELEVGLDLGQLVIVHHRSRDSSVSKATMGQETELTCWSPSTGLPIKTVSCLSLHSFSLPRR